MNVENQLHVAEWIASEADIETLDTYKDNIPKYKDKNYTYIPIPSENKYYNLREETLVTIGSDQIIHPELHLMDVLRLIQDKPFLLINIELGTYYITTESGEFVTTYNIGIPNEDEYNDREFVEEEVEEMFGIGSYIVHTASEFRQQYPQLADEQIDKEKNPYMIITLSDINKRMMKEMMYSVFAELTSQLSNRIKNEYPDSELILSDINDKSVGKWKKGQLKGKEIHVVEYVNLSDMRQILRSASGYFVQACGFESKDDIRTLRKIINIRNHVMHPNRSLVYDRNDIPGVLDAINETQRIISNME